MSSWKKVKLGDVCFIRRGSSPRPIKDFLITDPLEGMPWVKIADATETKTRYLSHTNEFIRHEGVCKSVIVEPGDLILSNSGTAGLPKIMGIVACIHDGWQTFKDLNGIDRDFLYYYLLFIRARLLHNAYDSTMKNLTLDMLRDYEMDLPPIETQKKIAGILNSFDTQIEINLKIMSVLESQIMEIYKHDFEQGGIQSTCRMDEFFDISIGKTPPRKEQTCFTENPEDVTWVSISDMGACGLYISDSSEYLTQDAVSKYNVKVVPANTVLLSFKLTVGRVAITDKPLTTNEAIAHFITKDETIVEYLYCYLKRFQYATLGSTSSIATAINSKMVKMMPFNIPTKEDAISFHSKTMPVFEQIKMLQKQNRNYESMRDSLLQRLMLNKIDLEYL